MDGFELNRQQQKNPCGAILQAGSGGKLSPADAKTYFFGGISNATPAVASTDINRTYITSKGTIRGGDVLCVTTGGVSGTNEASSIWVRVNNTTDYLFSNKMAFDSLPKVTSNRALAIPVVNGDFIEWKWTSPTWATNPTFISFATWLYME